MRQNILKVLFLSISFFAFSREAISQDTSIKAEDLVGMTQTVKTLIEENQEISSKNQKLAQELEALKKNQSAIESRLKEANQEKGKLSSRLKDAEGEKNKSGQEIKKLQQNVEALDKIRQEYDRKIKELEEQLVKKEEPPQEYTQETLPEPTEIIQEKTSFKEEPGELTPPSAPITIKLREEEKVPASKSPQAYENLDLLAKIELSAKKEAQLKENAAKVHYNMGNSYVKKGEYTSAVQEYKEALKQLPNDADTYYNLAFVYDQYLKDSKTALDYYQKYLELEPEATDQDVVKERIRVMRSAGR